MIVADPHRRAPRPHPAPVRGAGPHPGGASDGAARPRGARLPPDATVDALRWSSARAPGSARGHGSARTPSSAPASGWGPMRAHLSSHDATVYTGTALARPRDGPCGRTPGRRRVRLRVPRRGALEDAARGAHVEADVEIGANTTIDRGSIDDTVIGAGTKHRQSGSHRPQRPGGEALPDYGAGGGSRARRAHRGRLSHSRGTGGGIRPPHRGRRRNPRRAGRRIRRHAGRARRGPAIPLARTPSRCGPRQHCSSCQSSFGRSSGWSRGRARRGDRMMRSRRQDSPRQVNGPAAAADDGALPVRPSRGLGCTSGLAEPVDDLRSASSGGHRCRLSPRRPPRCPGDPRKHRRTPVPHASGGPQLASLGRRGPTGSGAAHRRARAGGGRGRGDRRSPHRHRRPRAANPRRQRRSVLGRPGRGRGGAWRGGGRVSRTAGAGAGDRWRIRV